MPVQIHGFQFRSTDIPIAVDLYSELFGWVVQKSSPSHGELILPFSPRLILHIDLQDSICPSNPGSIVLQVEQNNDGVPFIFSHTKWKANFKLEFQDSKNNYVSYLDPWQNRIWLLT